MDRLCTALQLLFKQETDTDMERSEGVKYFLVVYLIAVYMDE